MDAIEIPLSCSIVIQSDRLIYLPVFAFTEPASANCQSKGEIFLSSGFAGIWVANDCEGSPEVPLHVLLLSTSPN